MDKKGILMILVLYQAITTGDAATICKDGQSVDIKCELTEKGATVSWFRVRDKPDLHFIASFGFNGDLRASSPFLSSIFSHAKIKQSTITLMSFNKDRDSGFYSCASQKGTELKFGTVVQLVGVKVEVAIKSPSVTTTVTPRTTAAPCVCGKNSEGNSAGSTNPLMLCSPFILGPLVGGCGLLLLLLIVTTLYCNKIRTRRCPHHHKRRPRAAPPGKQIPNRHM